ncbi:prephenate dehydratase [Rhodomicrobium vannielii ATCC 17100]|uniref:prephenate dehydratase n=1 Tax=Rhodomicrobium vannielii TaxID=1069 RepID=UPI001917CA14|nr:prephenate dehydratase [Rhodomicrobium vannielii]MBJ7535828.1 prephenate dehydratase [Rhodomicrobium vannielii ATCC 17100]
MTSISTAATATPAKIAYQGEPGANSHIACINYDASLEPFPCATFEEALLAVKHRAVRYALIPVENSVAGRVADVHYLLPNSGVHVVGEHFERIYHQLMALPGVDLSALKTVHSHTQALGQCRSEIQKLGLRPVPEADTAGSARMVAEEGDPTKAAIASKLAADIYGLRILKSDIEDAAHNTTRFLALADEAVMPASGNGPTLTTFVFRVRNVPAALYKALGGFATNGVNMTKLESYQPEGSFSATMFYADVEGHPEDRPLKLSLEELAFYSTEVVVLGTYPASPFRDTLKKLPVDDEPRSLFSAR